MLHENDRGSCCCRHLFLFLGMLKGYHFSVEGIQIILKGVPFCEKWCIKGGMVGPLGGAFLYRTLVE